MGPPDDLGDLRTVKTTRREQQARALIVRQVGQRSAELSPELEANVARLGGLADLARDQEG